MESTKLAYCNYLFNKSQLVFIIAGRKGVHILKITNIQLVSDVILIFTVIMQVSKL